MTSRRFLAKIRLMMDGKMSKLEENVGTLPLPTLKRLGFLPDDFDGSKYTSQSWINYINSIGMGKALYVQTLAEPIIQQLNHEAIILDYKKWSTLGMKPWLNARQLVLSEIQKQLGIGMYSAREDDQIVEHARRKGVRIPSLNLQWLIEHRNDAPIIKLLLQKRNLDMKIFQWGKLSKFQNRDGEVSLSGAWNGYSSYSGRFTARNLAMAALPKEMRQCYRAPRVCGKPGVYLSLDANQIELRLLAGAAQATRLLRQFQNRIDIHKYFTSRLLGIPEREVTDTERKLGKSLVYAFLYGAGKSKLDKIIMKSNMRVIQAPSELLATLYPQLMSLVDSFRDGDVLYYALQPTNVEPRIGPTWMQSSSKQNLPVQSATSMLMKQVMLQINDKVKVVNAIHDEFICLCCFDEVDEIKAIIQDGFVQAARSLGMALPASNLLEATILGGYA